MASSIRSERHKRLAQLIGEYRERSGQLQSEVAAKLGRHQPFIANIESGQRRVDIPELLQLAAAIGFDPHEAIDELLKISD